MKYNLDTNVLHNGEYYGRWNERIFPSISKSLVDIKTKATKKYSFADETKHKAQAELGIFKCEATLIIEYKTDGEAMKIARALKKLAETASVKLNVTFVKI